MPGLRKADEMPIDARIGARLKLRRKLLGLRLNDVAPLLGVTYQSLQKYEKGLGRMALQAMPSL